MGTYAHVEFLHDQPCKMGLDESSTINEEFKYKI